MTVEIVDPATVHVTYRHELMGATDIEQRQQDAADAFPGRADRSCARVATTCSRR